MEEFHSERGYGIIPYFPIQFLYGFFSHLEMRREEREKKERRKRGIKMVL